MNCKLHYILFKSNCTVIMHFRGLPSQPSINIWRHSESPLLDAAILANWSVALRDSTGQKSKGVRCKTLLCNARATWLVYIMRQLSGIDYVARISNIYYDLILRTSSDSRQLKKYLKKGLHEKLNTTTLSIVIEDFFFEIERCTRPSTSQTHPRVWFDLRKSVTFCAPNHTLGYVSRRVWFGWYTG